MTDFPDKFWRWNCSQCTAALTAKGPDNSFDLWLMMRNIFIISDLQLRLHHISHLAACQSPDQVSSANKRIETCFQSFITNNPKNNISINVCLLQPGLQQRPPFKDNSEGGSEDCPPVNLNQFRSEHFNLLNWRATRRSKWRQIFFSEKFSCN